MREVKAMAEKKKAAKKVKIDKAPTVREKITDTSKGAFIGKPIWTPARKK